MPTEGQHLLLHECFNFQSSDRSPDPVVLACGVNGSNGSYRQWFCGFLRVRARWYHSGFTVPDHHDGFHGDGVIRGHAGGECLHRQRHRFPQPCAAIITGFSDRAALGQCEDGECREVDHTGLSIVTAQRPVRCRFSPWRPANQCREMRSAGARRSGGRTAGPCAGGNCPAPSSQGDRIHEQTWSPSCSARAP